MRNERAWELVRFFLSVESNLYDADVTVTHCKFMNQLWIADSQNESNFILLFKFIILVLVKNLYFSFFILLLNYFFLFKFFNKKLFFTQTLLLKVNFVYLFVANVIIRANYENRLDRTLFK